MKIQTTAETALPVRAVFYAKQIRTKHSTTMFKTLNTRTRVQNDKFSTKNVEKTVDK